MPESSYPWSGLVDARDVSIGEARWVASEWHSGQASAMYALSSSGAVLSGLLGEVVRAECDAVGHLCSEATDAYDDLLMLGAFAEAALAAWEAEHPDAEDYPAVLFGPGEWEARDDA